MKKFSKKVLKNLPKADTIGVGFIALFFLYLVVEVAINIISLLYIF